LVAAQAIPTLKPLLLRHARKEAAMSQEEEIRLQGLPQGRLELESIRALIQDATKDTILWLGGKASEEERVHVRAIQGRLADLDGIITRRMQRRSSAKDEGDWPGTLREVVSLLHKAKEVRGCAVGKSWARLTEIAESSASTVERKRPNAASGNMREAFITPPVGRNQKLSTPPSLGAQQKEKGAVSIPTGWTDLLNRRSISQKEAAELLRCNSRTVRRRVRAKELTRSPNGRIVCNEQLRTQARKVHGMHVLR
jgi:hypothetical protein